MRFAFIDAWKEEWSVEFLCRVMQVTSRGFRAWRKRPMAAQIYGGVLDGNSHN